MSAVFVGVAAVAHTPGTLLLLLLSRCVTAGALLSSATLVLALMDRTLRWAWQYIQYIVTSMQA